jgi:hypothetical protein
VSLLARILREPLLHFLVLGGTVFALYAYRTGGEQVASPRDRIVVSEGRIQQMAEIFNRTWQRPPAPQELRGLIEAYVKEEIYYREALKLGLDRDDTLIRRRMQQKMEFLTEPADDALKATDADLQAFLDTNRTEFKVEPRLAFQQIFIKPNGAEEPTDARIEKVLGEARGAALDADVSGLGDAILLPHAMRLAAASVIDRDFGEGFSERLALLPRNAWSGPVKSPFGLHLVRITEFRDGYDPPLEAVRQTVEIKWRTAKRTTFRQMEYQRLSDKYEIVLPDALTKQKR